MCTRKICEGSTVLLSNLYDPWSYITTTSYIILQNEEFLIPCYWLDKEPILDKIFVQVEALEKQALEEFRNYRGGYICEVIMQVEKEFPREPYLHDYVDIAVANKGS